MSSVFRYSTYNVADLRGKWYISGMGKPRIEVHNYDYSWFAGRSNSENGWDPAWGDEKVYRHLLHLAGSGSRILDLGCAEGRVSLPFAIWKGATVQGVDIDARRLSGFYGVYSDYGVGNLVAGVWNSDVNRLYPSDVGLNDFVLALEMLTHMPKSEGLATLDHIVDFVAPGGYLAVNAPSIESPYYGEISYLGEQVEGETGSYIDWCGCSGTNRREVFSFFVPGEMESVILDRGGRIIDSDTVSMPLGVNKIRSVIAQF